MKKLLLVVLAVCLLVLTVGCDGEVQESTNNSEPGLVEYLNEWKEVIGEAKDTGDKIGDAIGSDTFCSDC